MSDKIFHGIPYQDLKLRFCPSPTGTPHVGMARTALFNWAFTRHVGGKLVFRIEDTDQERDSLESYYQILESLNWLGIDWDEGMEVGGPNGPYRQSERMDIYKDVLAKLLDKGFLYESFLTAEEIKERNLANNLPAEFGYDNSERDLTESQIAQYKSEGRKPVLRFKMPDEDITFDDLIRGDITFKKEVNKDFVVARADGNPLYTLTNPVDDALMGINLVLRGEDILSSTPRQIALYEALKELGIAKQTPLFGHLPYVMGEGNKKLSKRDPESNLLLHKEQGMIKEGLVNYLSLLGWSYAPDNDIFSIQQLINSFEVEKVNPNPARFDLKKCHAINGSHLRLLRLDDYKARLTPYLFRENLVSAENFEDLKEHEQKILNQAVPLVQERLQLLGQGSHILAFLFQTNEDLVYENETIEEFKSNLDQNVEILNQALEIFKNIDPDKGADKGNGWETQILNDAFMKKFIEEEQLKPKVAFTPLRIAITGKRISPPLFDALEILGREKTISRIEYFIKTFVK